VFGIPDFYDLPEFEDIKGFFKRLASLFSISNRKAHIGIIRYSDTASVVLKLDSYYEVSEINTFIGKMMLTGI
jgi:hypothetical protein